MDICTYLRTIATFRGNNALQSITTSTSNIHVSRDQHWFGLGLPGLALVVKPKPFLVFSNLNQTDP